MRKWFRKLLAPVAASFIAGFILLVLSALEVPKMIKDYLQTLPTYASVFIWIGFFLLILIEFYVGYRFGKMAGKDDSPTAAENYRTITEKQATIQDLKTTIQDLLAANKSLQESQNSDFQNELRQRDALLNEVAFLLEPQRNQKENIAAFVKVTRIQYSTHDFEHHPFPYLTFVFDISNHSVFDITLGDEIVGRLNFRRAELLAEKHFEQPPPIITAFGGTGCVRVVQRLTDVETASIKKAVKDRADRTNLNPPEIDFRDIVFTIKGSASFPQIVAKQLSVVSGGASRIVNLEHI